MAMRKYTILYLNNPDPIFYGDMDQKITQVLQKHGAEVIQAELDQLSFTVDQCFTFYKAGQQVIFDAFLAYGYMAPKHYQDFSYFNNATYAAGKVTLHNPEAEHILQNKLLQGIRFAQHKVPQPKAGAAFSIPSVRDLMRMFPKEAIVKQVEGYAGDGVTLSKSDDQTVNYFSKALWKSEQVIIQKFVPDSQGKSVRVLTIGGKAVSATQYQDSTNFKSNGYSNDFSIVSLMESRKRDQYFEIAEKAVQAIDPQLTIGGVDILDSHECGMQVLEINSWPEMSDSQEATDLPLFDYFAQQFIEKIRNSLLT